MIPSDKRPKGPWDDEDWRKASGIPLTLDDDSALAAPRDYSIPCETPSEALIAYVEGYWIWWCMAHHQPQMLCMIARLADGR